MNNKEKLELTFRQLVCQDPDLMVSMCFTGMNRVRVLKFLIKNQKKYFTSNDISKKLKVEQHYIKAILDDFCYKGYINHDVDGMDYYYYEEF